ncbi:major capsid protein [bacterium]|nr:major capsid protein [bacterium]
MSVKLLTRKSLMKVVQGAKGMGASLATLLGFTEKVWGTSSIDVHEVEGRLGLASYANSKGEAVLVERDGFILETITPPTVAEETEINADILEEVFAGTHQYEDVDPLVYKAQLLQEDGDFLMGRVERRREQMIARGIQDGQIVVSGRGVNTTIDLRIPSAHKKTLLTTARWGEEGVSPIADLRTWSNTAATDGRKRPNIAIMDSSAYGYLQKDPDFQNIFDNQRIKNGQIDPMWLDDDLVLMGELIDADLNLKVYVHHGFYEVKDDDGNVTATPYIDANRVILANNKATNIIHYAWLKDDRAPRLARYYMDTYKEETSVSKTFLFLKSKPLPIPHEPKTIMSIKVR